MSYYKFIELKNREIKTEDIETYLNVVNNDFFSGLLEITKFKNKYYTLRYEDLYFISVEINKNGIDINFTLKYRMNEIIASIFSQYIAEKYANYDSFKMEYEKILWDEISDEYVTIYEPDSIDRYIKYIIYDIGYVEDDIKKFAKKIKRNKIINKFKLYFNLY